MPRSENRLQSLNITDNEAVDFPVEFISKWRLNLMVCSASNLFLAVKDTIKVYDQDFVLVRQAKLETSGNCEVNYMCLEYVDNVPLLGLVDTGGNVFVINADTLHILERIYNQEISTWGIAICKTFGNLAISDNSHKVKVFNFQNQDGPLNVDKLVLHHRDNIPHVEFSPNGYQLVSVSIDTTCIVWDLITGQPTDIYQLNSWGWCCFFVEINDLLLVDENDEIWTKLFENDMNNLKYRPLSLDDEQGDSDTTGSSLRDSMNSNSLDQMDTFSDIPADLELGDDARQDSQWISNNSLTANLVPIGEAEENLTSSSPSSYEWFDKTHPRVVPKSKLASERALQYSKGPIILYSDVKSISIANGSDLHLGLDGIKNNISMNSGFDRICMKLWIPELSLAVMASQVGILVFLRIIKSAEGDLGIVVEMIYDVSATILGLSSMKVESCTRKSLYKVYCLTIEQKMLSFNVYT